MLTWKRALAALALLAALGLWLLGSPSAEERLARDRPELERRLAEGGPLLDPAELLELSSNTSVRLRLVDLREENEFNLFHLRDAHRVPLEELRAEGFADSLPKDSVVVLMSNGEGRAREAWLWLTAQRLPRVYLLQGGIHGWLEAVGAGGRLGPARADCPHDDCRRYAFEAALGDRHPESAPNAQALAGRPFTRKVKVESAQKRKAGSCG